MEKKKSIYTTIYIYAFMILASVIWLLAFMTRHEIIKPGFDIENAGLITIGVIIFFVFTFIKDIFYIMPIVTLTPFVFARAFDVNTMPISLYFILAFVVAGVVMHIILYRTTFSFGKFFKGLLIFCVGVILGGLGNNVSILNVTLVLLIALGILVFYVFSISYLNKHEFSELCHIMTSLGLMLIFQTIMYHVLLHPTEMFINKDCDVGWGRTNNIAIIMLMCVPFTMYFTVNSKSVLGGIMAFISTIEFLCIVFNYSRGGVLSALIIYPIALVYCLIKNKNKLCYGIYLGVALIIVFIAGIVLNKVKPDLFESIWDNLTRINGDTLNGRKPIYDRMLEASKSHLFFGVGLLDSFNPETSYYDWGHNVFIHTLYTTGLFGLVCICIHLFEKYYLLIKKPSVKKMFVLFAFLASGLYGLMDVGYYFINFMIVLAVILVLIENEIDTTL